MSFTATENTKTKTEISRPFKVKKTAKNYVQMHTFQYKIIRDDCPKQ